ncbi:MAG: NHLP bacteriocin system secretion protein [Candidatus Atribacteria bacterium]|nr:NHLP bacteriocin system secretion protein [Candidatus Atribacteria bacterium]
MERLSSPEELDQLMTVTTPRAWLFLLAIGLILATLVLWSLTGTLPTRVFGEGVLLRSGGVQMVVHPLGGQITDIRVKPGDEVRKGEVLARVDQPQLVQGIVEWKEKLKNLVVGSGESRDREIQNAKAQISRLQEEFLFYSTVVTPIDGRVLEVKVNRGEIIEAGVPLLDLEQTGEQAKNLEVVLYIPVEEGKKILPGMEAQISPTVVKKEEYGYLVGKVVSVSEFPATNRGMMRTLGNEDLVKQLSGQGAPIEVHIDLIIDKNTPSGYQWSSPQGPPVQIDSGTVCSGSVTISKERPIEQVFPSFHAYLKKEE